MTTCYQGIYENNGEIRSHVENKEVGGLLKDLELEYSLGEYDGIYVSYLCQLPVHLPGTSAHDSDWVPRFMNQSELLH